MNNVLKGLCSFFAVTLICVAPIFAQEPPAPPKMIPKIEGPSLAVPGQELRLSVTGLTTPPLSDGIGKLQEWSTKLMVDVDVPDGGEATLDPDLSLGFGQQSVKFRLFFVAAKGGEYVIFVHDANSATVIRKRIKVGPVVPQPDPPPGPNPPGPAPIPLSGLRVLILEETSNRQSLPPSQVSVLTSGEIRGYLNTKCAKNAAGSPEYRVLDIDNNVSALEKHWQDAVDSYKKLPSKTLPWLIVSDGKTGYQGPLPVTVDETMTLLKKYGG